VIACSRRSEKLYVTKDKRSGGGWKKCLVWTFVAFAFAAIVAVGVIVAGESTLSLSYNVEIRKR